MAGAIAERGNLRRTLLVTQTARALSAFLMFAVWVAGIRSPWIIVSVVLLAGSAQGLSMPSWQALTPALVPRADLGSAVTLNAVQFNLARSFGPALGGVILLACGPSVAFLLTFLAILAVIAAIWLIRPHEAPRGGPPQERGVLRQFARAVGYTRRQPGIANALVIVAVVGLLGMPVFQHIIVYAHTAFAADPSSLTLMNLGLGVGAIIAVPVVSGLEHTVRRSTFIRLALPAYGLLLVAFAFVQSVWPATVVLVLVGAAFLTLFAVATNAVQIIVANHVRGRVMALYVMVYTASVAGGAYLQGFTADRLGTRETLAVAGVLLVVVAVVMGLARGRRSLRRLDDPYDDDVAGDGHQ